MDHSQRTRSETIYVAKGIGIALVVIGHYLVPNLQPKSWEELRLLIYTFHMPLFMIISGYLHGYGNTRTRSLEEYAAFVRRKFERLMYPYFTVTLILLTLKVTTGPFLKLQSPIDNDFLKYIFLNPMGGFTTDLWFIYTLFVIFVLFPLTQTILKNDVLIVIVSLILSFVSWPSAFCLNFVFHYLPYFAVGHLLSRYLSWDNLNARVALACLTLSLAMFVLINRTKDVLPLTESITGIFPILLAISGSAACILGAFFVVRSHFLAKPLSNLGIYSVVIYLTHMIPLAAVRIAVFDVFKSDSTMFWPSLAAAGLLGMIAPMLIQIHFISRSSIGSRFVLGETPRHLTEARPRVASSSDSV